MKKLWVIVLLGIIFPAVSFSIVLAQPGKFNREGEIIAVDEAAQAVIIQDPEGQVFEIHFPAKYPFTFTVEDIGMIVYLKGELQEDGSIVAEWVKSVEVDEDDLEWGKGESAFCSGEKEKHHPAALFLAYTFEKDIEEIMGYFCDGFGFGQISLALQTEKMSGVYYGILLVSRVEGKGWGEIWQELGYKDKPKEDDKKTPPGHEKNPDKEKDKDKDKDKDKGVNHDDEPKDKDKFKDQKPKKVKKEKKDK